MSLFEDFLKEHQSLTPSKDYDLSAQDKLIVQALCSALESRLRQIEAHADALDGRTIGQIFVGS